MRQFFKAVGVDILKTKALVTKGASESLPLVAGGNCKMGISTEISMVSALDGGLVRAVAITGNTRSPFNPSVPSAGESGFPGVNVKMWNGISGPPKLPAHVVDKWERDCQEMLKDPEIIAKLKNMKTIPYYQNSSGTRKYVEEELEEVKKAWGVK